MPKFQKRHYEAIADVLRTIHKDQQVAIFTDPIDTSKLIRRIGDMFAGDNPRFDRARFVAACHLTK